MTDLIPTDLIQSVAILVLAVAQLLTTTLLVMRRRRS